MLHNAGLVFCSYFIAVINCQFSNVGEIHYVYRQAPVPVSYAHHQQQQPQPLRLVSGHQPNLGNNGGFYVVPPPDAGLVLAANSYPNQHQPSAQTQIVVDPAATIGFLHQPPPIYLQQPPVAALNQNPIKVNFVHHQAKHAETASQPEPPLTTSQKPKLQNIGESLIRKLTNGHYGQDDEQLIWRKRKQHIQLYNGQPVVDGNDDDENREEFGDKDVMNEKQQQLNLQKMIKEQQAKLDMLKKQLEDHKLLSQDEPNDDDGVAFDKMEKLRDVSLVEGNSGQNVTFLGPTSLMISSLEQLDSPRLLFGSLSQQQIPSSSKKTTTTTSTTVTPSKMVIMVCDDAVWQVPIGIYGCCGKAVYRVADEVCNVKPVAEETVIMESKHQVVSTTTPSTNTTSMTTTQTSVQKKAMYRFTCNGRRYAVPLHDADFYGCCGHNLYFLAEQKCVGGAILSKSPTTTTTTEALITSETETTTGNLTVEICPVGFICCPPDFAPISNPDGLLECCVSSGPMYPTDCSKL